MLHHFLIMPVKAVLIDLDNTLYESNKCNQIALDTVINKLSEIFNKPKDQVREIFEKSRRDLKIWLKDTASSHSRLLYFQKTIEILKGSTDIKLTQEIDDLFWQTYFSQMQLFEGVIDFFTQLKNSGIKIAIITDLIADTQFRKIRSLGIENYIDFVVTSEEAGRDKPAEPIFLLALEKLKLSVDDALIIGDDSEKDIAGGKNLDIPYIQIQNNDFKSVIESFKSFNSV